LRNRPVFVVRSSLGAHSAEERARSASETLQKVADAKERPDVRVDDRADAAIIYVAERLVIQLGQEDALLAGDVSLSVHAASVAAQLRDAFTQEQKREGLLKIGLNLLFVVVAALIAMFLVRRVGRVGLRTRRWIGDRLPALRVQSIDVVRASTLRMVLGGTIRLAVVVLQIGIAYGWLLLSLSRFEATQSYTERLTDIVLNPISAFTSKLGGSLPLIIVSAASIVALIVLLRFVGTYFGSAARGETTIEWVPPDLIGPTSLVIQTVIVVLFLVIVLPLMTGNEDSALSRVGLIALVSLGIATTPVLASACVGVTVVYGRRLRVGDFASFGPLSGRVQQVTLLEVRLSDPAGHELRIPHLFALWYPTRIFGPTRPVSATITVASASAQATVRQVLTDAAATAGTTPQIELVSVDARGALYRVTVGSPSPDAESALFCAITDALAQRGIPLGIAPAASERT
jgi:small-conductance mechanosensitive channel